MQVNARPSKVVPITAGRAIRSKRLQYIGPLSPARCACGATRSRWWVRKVRDHGGYRTTSYRCKCGRPVVKVDAL